MAKRTGSSSTIEGRFVSYLRVSTKRQGESGLGLEAQREAVRSYLAGRGWPPIAEYVEIESGKRNDRPELARALAACKLYGAVLVVAKLDRLARNVAFVSALMESGVEFTAVDFPQANTLTIHILAAVAEHERKMISARTMAALAAAKARGTVLGGFRGFVPGQAERTAAAAAKAQAADGRADRLRDVVAEIRAAGITSASGISKELNRRNITTAKGGMWQTVQVQRLVARLR